MSLQKKKKQGQSSKPKALLLSAKHEKYSKLGLNLFASSVVPKGKHTLASVVNHCLDIGIGETKK